VKNEITNPKKARIEDMKIRRFKDERRNLNSMVMKYAGKNIKQFYNLDSSVFESGELPRKIKELLGLVASLVARCDDCVKYHISECIREGITNNELQEALAIALVIGGSITIPHLRRAFAFWDANNQMKQTRRKPATLDKKQIFDAIIPEIKGILKTKYTNNRKLLTICRLLKKKVSHYDWVGFYIVDKKHKKELFLGPFEGEPTEHTRIPFGSGICGQAVVLKKPFIVQDVTKETNYLSCSMKVLSEIVLPIFKKGKIVGELDIDSHSLSPFTSNDKNFLENVCNIVSCLF